MTKIEVLQSQDSIDMADKLTTYAWDEISSAIDKMKAKYEAEAKYEADDSDAYEYGNTDVSDTKSKDEPSSFMPIQNMMAKQKEHDAVNHPSYYCGNIEVIDFIEDKNLGYHLGNAIKYISRAGKKHEMGMSDLEKEIEDLKKARFYLNRKIKMLEEECRQAL